jgi:acyl transferase domain-containing protein
LNSSGNHHAATEADFTPLAIVGMGGIFPQAENLMQFWHNIRDGVDSITDIPSSHWNPAELYDPDPKKPDHVYGNKGGFLPPVDFEPMKYGVLPNALEAIDTSQLLGLVAVEQALNDAGYGTTASFDREKVSVILGVTGALELVVPLGARLGHPRWRKALQEAGVDDDTAQDVIDRIGDSYTQWQENSFPGLLGNVVAGRISKHFNFGGTNCVVDAACGSSLSAINLAALELATGRADMVVTGGVDTFNDVFMYSCFSKTPALSPSGHARPFDADADGTTLGEAIGIVVLKRLSDAERDGDRIYAVIKGLGTSSDGSDSAIYEPDASGQQKAVLRAYEQADVAPRSVGMIEAHGTGTRVGDGIEVKALQQVFGDGQQPWCALGSVKSQIGHTKAAAGAAGLIKSTLALYHKVLPPTIKVTQPRNELQQAGSPFYINAQSRPWLSGSAEPRRAGVSALGFGGSNYHCLLEEYTTEKQGNDWTQEVQWFALSADSREQLRANLDAIALSDDWNALRRVAAQSRQAFDAAADYRLCWVVQRSSDQAAQRQLILQALSREDSQWQTPDGVFFSARPCDGATAVLFPGQGATYPHMLHDLAMRFPAFFEVLEEADRYFPADDGRTLSEYIYPRASFDANGATQAANELQATDVAQPALGAVSLAGFALLRAFGLQVDACAGHSYGELSALCAAGVLRSDAFHRLSRVRGELMAAAANGGAMLAVFASLETIEAMIEEQGWDVVLANRNTPAQGVISGSTAAIATASAHLQAQGIGCKQLDVAAAFHSRFVSEAVAPLAQYLDNVDWQTPTSFVYANTTADIYPSDSDEARCLLAEQLAHPVDFVAQIEAMYQAGVRTFVEVGPHARLSAMVAAILGDRDYHTVALDASQGKQSGVYDFACMLARLSALGQPIDGTLWDEDLPPEPVVGKRVLRIPLCGANPFTPKPARPPRPRTVAAPATKETPVTVEQPKPTITPESKPVVQAAVSPRTPTQPQAAAMTPPVAMPEATLGQGVQALQDIQMQTARLHEQFLKGQEEATRAMMALLGGQVSVVSRQSPVASEQVASQQLSVASVQSPVVSEPVAVASRQSPVVSEQVAVASQQVPVVSEQAALSHDAVAETVFAIIAEKTGYPVDMLEADMSLDGDLGVDSIKRVEILSAVQMALPDAPVITPEDLGVLQTLGQMVAHLGVQSPVVSGQSSVVSEQPAVAETVFAIIAEKTGYPVDMLEADMSLDGDLGVDSIKRVEILSAVQTALPDAPAITPEHMGQLGSLADITAFLAQAPERSSVETTTSAGETTPEIAAPATIHRQCLTLLPWASEGLARISHPAGARCWLLAGDDDVAHSMEHSLQEAGYEVVVITPGSSPTPPESLHALFMIAPESAMTDSLMWQYFAVLQRAESALRATEHSILATVSRMDGQFGLSGLVHDPLSGGLHGMLKTAHHEWSEVRCTAFDIPADSHAIATASLLDAALVVDSPLEIACAPEGMSALYCYDAPVVESNEPLPVQAGDLVVVSGGGRGVTAHVAIALARATQATIMLLGRSPLHDEAAWLAGIDDEMAIKQALMQHSDSPLTPRDLAAAYRQVVAQREVRATMAAIEQAGGTVLYRSVDVTNANDVAWLIGEVRAEHGAVKGVIHGAGVLADRLIGDKTQDQFERVYNTKVAGLRALLDATKDDPLRFVLLFSSSTGRFGRRGQVDYAIANEVLNKHAQAIAVQRPDCRVMAPNWGPWDGGMVTPALKQVFAEEGIAVIDLDAGAAYVLQELRTPPGSDVEMVILGGNEAAPTPPADSQVANPRPAFIITQEEPAPATLKAEPSAWEMVVSLDDYPFLTSHVMNNQAVLPMAMMVEWMAYAAIHANPGLLFHGFEELRVLKAVTVQEQQARALRFVCEPMQTVDDNFHIAVSLHSQGDEDRLHARCTIVLREHYPSAPHAAPLPDLQAWPHPMHTVYQDGHLFHGPDLHALVEITGYADDAIHARVLTAPSPDQWIETPVSNQWLADPLALDGSFQLMILWAFERHNMGSLPVYAGAYQQYISHFPDDGVDVRIRISDVSGAQVEAAIEWIDPASGALLARMDDYRCVMDASLADSFQRTDLQHANEASNDAHHE